MTRRLQEMMNITVFILQIRQECTMTTFVAVAECLLDFTCLKSNTVPKESFRVDEFMDIIASSLGEILRNIPVASHPPYYPIIYSLQEFIKTVFIGQKVVRSVLF
jgi:hypothetical protein